MNLLRLKKVDIMSKIKKSRPSGERISWRRLSVSPNNVAGSSQMKHLRTSRWNAAVTS